MKDKNIVIVTHRFYDLNLHQLNIGGVETMINVIVSSFSKRCKSISVIQQSNSNKKISHSENVDVYGFKSIKEIKRKVEDEFKKDLIIFLNFDFALRCQLSGCIVFQHGVEFDGFHTRRVGLAKMFSQALFTLNHFRYKRRLIRLLSKPVKIICVDHNFPNWFRATFPFNNNSSKLRTLPNFHPYPIERCNFKKIFQARQAEFKRTGRIKILVARRFEVHRGLPLMMRIANRIVKDNSKVDFTFIGGGSQEALMHTINLYDKQITISSVPNSEMEAQFERHDISIIPTLWSEGTSLTCVESMAKGCAIVTTNVGGLSNLVIDGYNGLVVEPNENAIEKALRFLISEEEKRYEFGRNANSTALSSFAVDKWLTKLEKYLFDEF